MGIYGKLYVYIYIYYIFMHVYIIVYIHIMDTPTWIVVRCVPFRQAYIDLI